MQKNWHDKFTRTIPAIDDDATAVLVPFVVQPAVIGAKSKIT